MSAILNKTIMAKEIKATILSLANPDKPLPNELSDNDVILELGILDSSGVLNLITWYESHYSIDLEDDEIIMENLGTIEKMVHYVFKKKGL